MAATTNRPSSDASGMITRSLRESGGPGRR